MRSLFDALPFHVLAPSEIALSVWQRASESPHVSARVHAHCQFESLPPEAPEERPACGTAADPVRVAFAGFPMTGKGWPLFQELLQRVGALPAYRFYHVSNPETVRPMRNLRALPVQVTARHRLAMVDALTAERIDVVLLLSPWPETFSFVTYEALASGADVVALAASGNAAALVRHHARGVVLRDDTALFDFFADGSAVCYCRRRAVAGRQRGRLALDGSAATLNTA
jgi:hypothetical protein